ncbi:DUF1905 domain-containing protein [Sandaracinobacter sp. RS1-74]|uniref:DUF1905 domain-containing protein n=1 Tax=Sandaracinobacteroides sayramensis TaxID=2913411 RepID=UPI001EDBC7BB|nr:DUF1905 domain-containing protein [Sandaracinobacteroides sayramensis]MCG2840216.1 DUF1905 domain-containing protein [Sandaracinobacteroides sayramensis]
MAPLPPFEAELWAWSGPATWVFLTLPAELADDVRLAGFLAPRGWGSVRVEAEIGGIVWRTSVFPDGKSGSYLLPVKADVRRKAGVAVGERVRVTLRLVDQAMI